MAKPKPPDPTRPAGRRPAEHDDPNEQAPRASDPGTGIGVDLSRPGPSSSSPQMPHERDERVGMTGGTPSEVVEQGARDLKRGLQDTSRADEADRAYTKQKK